MVRSDGTTLHVDFENVTDTLIVARNAGVLLDAWTRDPRSRIRIVDTFAFDGRRCVHIAASGAQGTYVRLIRAYDADPACEDAVLEFVYRPALDTPVDLVNWLVLGCSRPDGTPVAIELRATGSASEGTYAVDVIAGEGTVSSALENLSQTAWIRFILHRHEGIVDLYAGPPDEEVLVGTYPDRRPEDELYAIAFGNAHDETTQGAGYWDAARLGHPLDEGGQVAPPEGPVRNVGATVPTPPDPLLLGTEKHLLIDTWSIAEQHNIRRTFHRPTKYPDNPLILPEKPWETADGLWPVDAIYLFGGVEKQPDGLYRMWYYAADPTPENRKNAHTCLALSEDGIHWTKPSLGIHEYNGSRDNNIVIMESGPYSIILDPDDPRPDFRYKAHLRYQGTSGWTSPDGLHWTSHGVILPQSLDASSVHLDPIRNKYIATIKLWYRGRRYRGYAESDDFLHWSDTYPMMDIDERDAFGDQIYAMKIFRYESLYLGLTKIYHVETTDTCDTHLAVSHNITHWERPFRRIPGPKFATPERNLLDYTDEHEQPFIPTGLPGAWDFGNNDTTATPPIREGDELRFYYSGRSHTHNDGFPEGDAKPFRHRGSIGLATLRVDGFVSADADPAGGWLLTRPLQLRGTELLVNADALGGALRVEILDEHLNPIEPFTLANAHPITTDAVQIPCTWRGGEDLSALGGRTIHLKFHLTHASLYAFWTEHR